MSNIIGTINEPEPSVEPAPREFALFNYGFRPFFLLGPIFSVAALLYFVLLMAGSADYLPSKWDMFVWHRHEMLFGYSAAIIAGFLLTAVPNWTGHPTPKGFKLAILAGIWLAGRAVVFTSALLPPTLVGLVDASFFVACALAIAGPLIKSRNRRNYFFIILLFLLAAANFITHFGDVSLGINIALNVVVMMMVAIGGRVIPFFTEKPLGISIPRDAYIERLAIASTLLALVMEVVDLNHIVTGALFMTAAVANGIRLSRWNSFKTFRIPLLWVLHTGYAWLVLGFAFKALHYLGVDISASIATHCFTAGGIGVLTLGMMSRVALGHSGRLLVVGRVVNFAFICINLAALLRVFGVMLSDSSWIWLEAAAICWLVAFGIFIIKYSAILILPRPDGRAG